MPSRLAPCPCGANVSVMCTCALHALSRALFRSRPVDTSRSLERSRLCLQTSLTTAPPGPQWSCKGLVGSSQWVSGVPAACFRKSRSVFQGVPALCFSPVLQRFSTCFRGSLPGSLCSVFSGGSSAFRGSLQRGLGSRRNVFRGSPRVSRAYTWTPPSMFRFRSLSRALLEELLWHHRTPQKRSCKWFSGPAHFVKWLADYVDWPAAHQNRFCWCQKLFLPYLSGAVKGSYWGRGGKSSRVDRKFIYFCDPFVYKGQFGREKGKAHVQLAGSRRAS